MILFVHLPFRGRIAFAGIMGTRFTTLSPLLAAAAIMLPAPAEAQEEAAPPLPSLPRPQNPSQQPPPSRQGPELDVYRDVPGTAPAPVTPPPVTVTTPPPVAAPTPVPASPTPTPRARPERAPERAAPVVERESGATQPRPAPVEAPPPSSSEAIVAPQTGNVAGQAPAPSPPVAAPAAPVAATDSGLPWGWIGVGLVILLAGGIALFLRRRPREGGEGYRDDSVPDEAPPQPLRPVAAPTRRPAAPPHPTAERAWIDVELAIESARYSLLGVSIGYRLTLRNRGQSVASDMLIHALIGNADANQNDLLRAFFAGTKGMPVHSVVSIAPGQTQILTNELRLEPDAIDPLELDGRLLLVPLIGFDVHYRWDADGTPGSGRTGSAFIVGQEQVPPTQKLAPFRFDQGPRQYRDVGCRRTALSLAS